jgi:tetratricopeptide (TPR) repeat protein
MRKTYILVLSLILSSSVFSMDFTNDEFNFDSEEVKQVFEEQPEARKMLELGKKAYDQKKYLSAANQFYKVIEKPEYQASYSEAYFNLGKALRKEKFYYVALYYFDLSVKDGEQSPFFNATLKYLSDLSKYIQNEKLLSNISKYDPKVVPQKYKQSLYFLAGKYNYQKGNFAKAVQYLKLLPKESSDYLKSRYLLGVLYARLGKGNTSIENFKEIIDYKGKILDELEHLKLVELSIIGTARVYYQQKEFDLSILYFNKIPRFSEQWLDGIFESSWAFLMKGDYAKSLGNLVTLRSPSFYKAFYPEKYIIEALIYYNNCDYQESNKIVKKFLDEYRPVRKTLTQFIKSAKTPFEFYNVISKSRKETSDPKLQWVLNIALKDKSIKKKFTEIKIIDKEISLMKKKKDVFLKTPFAKTLIKILDEEKKNIETEIGDIALGRFKRVVNTIKKLLTDARVITQAILEIKEDDVTKELISLKINQNEYFELDKEKIILSTPEDHIYWPFEGEYWKDELGYYLYPIVSQCKKK